MIRQLTIPHCSWIFWCLLLMMGTGCSPKSKSPVYHSHSHEEAPRSVFTAAEDTLILARIKTKLFSDDLVDQGEIDIRVRHGVVFLEGDARDIYHRRMIIDLIRTVDGVARVENRLNMIHSGTTFVTTDTRVRDQVKMALLKDVELSTWPIRVEADPARIKLTGTVGSHQLKQKAAAIAKSHAGDRQVVDQLKIDN